MTTPSDGRVNAAEEDPTVSPDDEVGTSGDHGVPTDAGDRSVEPDEPEGELPERDDDEPQVGLGPTD